MQNNKPVSLLVQVRSTNTELEFEPGILESREFTCLVLDCVSVGVKGGLVICNRKAEA